MEEEYEIDEERLRGDLLSFFEGAYFVGGFGAALMEREEISHASLEDLIRIANQKGFSLENYIVGIQKRK